MEMQRTGRFIEGRWGAKIELLPGEYEVFTKPARYGSRSGQLVFTNQRIIWRPTFKRKASETDMLLIAHERVGSCDAVRPWQTLFLSTALVIRLRDGETLTLYTSEAHTMLPTIRQFMSRERYRPGDLFS
jgi:hypothetical protein